MPIAAIGDDFVVNSTTVNDQLSPSVTTLPNGRFVMMWQSDAIGDFNIRARLYNADGSPFGSEFVINSTIANDQSSPSVTALADGRFFVTWTSDEGATGDDIRARLFNADGTPVDDDFVVNSTTANDQSSSSVTTLLNGRLLVTWTSDEGATGDDIRARLYNADGTPVGDDFIVNTTTANTQQVPSVTSLAGGRYLVTWTSLEAGLDNIRARLYNLNGTPVGNDFVVNTTVALGQISPSATSLADGRYVVTWWSIEGLGNTDIRARVFNANGTPVGDDFIVNSTTANQQIGPSVTALADGRFVVSWQSDEGGGDLDIRARLFNLDGTPSGNDFIVNTTTANDQQFTSVTALADGRFVVTWQSDEGGGDFDIRSRIFDPTIFVGTGASDVWSGGNFADTVQGGVGFDVLSGLGGNDVLSGDSGNDTLSGGAGSDGLFGGSGTDLLNGGLGKDSLAGGSERDLFDFNSIKESRRGANRDVIQDFQSGDNVTGDDIDLTGIDAKTGAGNQAFHFIGTQHFHNHKGELRFIDKGASCIVQGDVNGDGRADFEILVKVGTLHQGDFLL